MFLFAFCLRIGNPISTCAAGGMEEGSSKMCTGSYRRRGVSRLICTYALTLFSCSCLMVPCFICRNLVLPSFKKGVSVRNGYYSPMRSSFVIMK